MTHGNRHCAIHILLLSGCFAHPILLLRYWTLPWLQITAKSCTYSRASLYRNAWPYRKIYLRRIYTVVLSSRKLYTFPHFSLRPVLTRSQSSLWSGGSGGQNQHPHHHQVWPLTQFYFACPVQLTIELTWGKSMALNMEDVVLFCSFQQIPCFGLSPLNGFWIRSISAVPSYLLPGQCQQLT